MEVAVGYVAGNTAWNVASPGREFSLVWLIKKIRPDFSYLR